MHEGLHLTEAKGAFGSKMLDLNMVVSLIIAPCIREVTSLLKTVNHHRQIFVPDMAIVIHTIARLPRRVLQYS